ncbi:MAG: M23 family metallopeptidase [Spirochaetaceae bacterium]|nr:M23 family metallopeptidase [Spirochaetaceae bacterium]
MSLCFAAACAAGEASPLTATLVLEGSLRPGDPLLAWFWAPASLEGGTAELLDAAGKRLGAARTFAMPAAYLAAAGLSPAPAAGLAPAAPAPAAGPAPAPAAATPAPAAAAPAPAAATERLYGILLALPLEAKPGACRLVVRGQVPAGGAARRAFSAEAGLVVEPRTFISEDIPLDAANTAIRKEPDPKKEAEARALAELLARVDADAVYLDAPFVLPVDAAARRSSTFGDERRYLYASGGADTSRHLGVDFAVVKGTPVRAAGRGRVVFAGQRIVTGTTLVIEHLPGLYSIYMHLAEASVQVGRLVQSGEIVGKSGNSGLSTGPHLHWELRAGGRAVDPDFLVARPPLDKARLIATMATRSKGGD